MADDKLSSLVLANSCGNAATLVEIGTWNGDFAEQLLTETNCRRLFCVDPYKNFSDQEYLDNFNISQKEFDEKYEQVKARLSKFGDRVEMLRMTSEEAATLFENESLDFVYIDGNHQYFYADQDIQLWYPKVKKGGYLCGDDVFSTNLDNYDATGNMYTAARIVDGKPEGISAYGVYTACLMNESRFGVKFQFEKTQFHLKKD